MEGRFWLTGLHRVDCELLLWTLPPCPPPDPCDLLLDLLHTFDVLLVRSRQREELVDSLQLDLKHLKLLKLLLPRIENPNDRRDSLLDSLSDGDEVEDGEEDAQEQPHEDDRCGRHVGIVGETGS